MSRCRKGSESLSRKDFERVSENIGRGFVKGPSYVGNANHDSCVSEEGNRMFRVPRDSSYTSQSRTGNDPSF